MESTKRECGECQVCCFLLEVKQVPTEQYKMCPSQCESGCAKYQDRPSSCVSFECEWLKGDLNEEQRPDKMGLMFMWNETIFGKAMTVREFREGALIEHKTLLEKIGAEVLTIVMSENDRGILGPRAAMRKVQKIIAKTQSGMGRFVPKE